jgi:hypothetical protein
MSQYKIRASYTTQWVGAVGSEVIDLVEDLCYTEDQAKEIFNGAFPDYFKEDLQEWAIDLSGLEYDHEIIGGND